ncbi:MAG: pirin family protein [Candidatus Eremiobacteraeota bacterium]|nr:pirin family protein [Candidatus Eremiobacteraeota bacterium]
MKTLATPPQTFAVQRSQQRYFADHAWLKTYHSFSFADYFDPNNERWGALRVFNDDRIAPAQGFPPHPHRDMEILTYVLAGELEHEDSMGNRGVVRDGGVQFMSAGTGVRHSEFNHSKSEELHLVQMWVLPGKVGTKPSYGQKDFTVEDRRDRWLVVASGEKSLQAPIALTQDATLRVARLEGSSLEHDFAPQRYGFLFVAHSDSLVVNGEKLDEGDAVRIYDIPKLDVSGTGEAVFWDLPTG